MLEHIKENICPTCGEKRIEIDTKYSQHTNGHWNETRKFKCGYMLHYSPNYIRVEVKEHCKESEECKRETNIYIMKRLKGSMNIIDGYNLMVDEIVKFLRKTCTKHCGVDYDTLRW